MGSWCWLQQSLGRKCCLQVSEQAIRLGSAFSRCWCRHVCERRARQGKGPVNMRGVAAGGMLRRRTSWGRVVVGSELGGKAWLPHDQVLQ